jgi:hypothetical protein
MKYKLKIVQEDGMYVGYALENDEVKAKTAPCKDSITASRNLTTLINSGNLTPSKPVSRTFKAIAMNHSTPASTPQPQPQPPPSSAPRRCCGRG